MDSDRIVETSTAKTSNWVLAEGKLIIKIKFVQNFWDFVLATVETHRESSEGSHGRPNSRVTERLSLSQPANSTQETPILHNSITSTESLVPEAPTTARIVSDRGDFPDTSALKKRASSI